MKIQIIGHAALVITIDKVKILVDPVLNWIGTLLLVKDKNNTTESNKKILPIPELDLIDMLKNLDAVLYTNPSVEKIESKAFKIFANNVPILCHPKDQEEFDRLGFRYIEPISKKYTIETINITIPDISSKKLFSKYNQSQGFMIVSESEEKILLTGNTLHNDKLINVIKNEQPNITIFNSISSNKLKTNLISNKFINTLKEEIPEIMLIGINMDTGNHCLLSRQNLDINIHDNICYINY